MLGLVAAHPRELAPLVRDWKPTGQGVFTLEAKALATACGMGPDCATRAAATLLDLGATTLLSIGWAGGISARATTASVWTPATIVDAATGERFATGIGQGTLVTVRAFAFAQHKRALAAQYSADLVDMEAAAVARHAARHNITFYAVKAVSDSLDAHLPITDAMVRNGQVSAARFLAYIALRPWAWPHALRMGRNAQRASVALAHELERWLAAGGPPQS